MIAFKSTLQSASRLGRPAKANGHCPNSLGAFLYNPLPLPILFCSGDFRGYQAVRRGSWPQRRRLRPHSPSPRKAGYIYPQHHKTYRAIGLILNL